MVTEFGYAGKILRVDLSSRSIREVPTLNYSDRFVGGRGVAAKIYWDEVLPNIKAFDPENRLIFVTGPLAGIPGLAGSILQICGKSPATAPEQFCYSNLGGSWGAYLKFAGFDGIVIQGKADKPVYLIIEDGMAQIRDGSSLWVKNADEVKRILKNEFGSVARVITYGPAGDHEVAFACLSADDDSSASSGFGAVMGSKKLKAIVVRGNRKIAVANAERLQKLTKTIRELKRDATRKEEDSPEASAVKKKALCWGCIRGCSRAIYKADDGKVGKFMCQASDFYKPWALKYYGKWNDVPFYANKLCNDYGLDTKAIAPMLIWLSRCGKAGILTDESAGIPISRLGSLEFIEALVDKISRRDSFGDILALGTQRAAEWVGIEAMKQLADMGFKAGQTFPYSPAMYFTTGLLYMVEPRQPIQVLHEISDLVTLWIDWVKKKEHAYVSSDVIRLIAKKFWGSEMAADFSTYEGKALAAKLIQNRQYAKESLILCDFSWPITHVRYSEDHVGDPTLESQVVSEVTGREIDENGLYQIGERVFNLQRAILIREGCKGRESDTLPEVCYTTPLASEARNPECLVPGEGGEVISKKGAVFNREKFEIMKDEYYALRGWDRATGLPQKETLQGLELNEVARDLEQQGLIGGGLG
jgi:aldehyde:ferredoxin oxidoreductase